MTLPDVWELFEYWRDYPPTHVILAARYKISPDSDRGEPTGDEAMVLNALAQNGPVKGSATLPLAVQAALEQMRKTNGG